MGKKSKSANSFQCFVCQESNLDRNDYNICEHDSLKVTMCDSCNEPHSSDGKWHSTKEWKERDDKGKCIYCEICGEGGTLLPCDDCSFSYCTNKCLLNWLGEKVLNDLLEDENIPFKCFACVSESSRVTRFPLYRVVFVKCRVLR